MNYNELLTKYHALQSENHRLSEENKRLRLQLGIPEQPGIPFDFASNMGVIEQESMPEMIKADCNEEEILDINNLSIPAEKIRLFMSLFKGRADVYAKRWENKKKGTSGYSPVCLNEWRPGLCAKPRGKCTDCAHKAYDVLEEKVIDAHLRGLDNFVAEIYPLLPDETCCFLAIDFDDEEWQKDISILWQACSESAILLAIERSRSGKGAHAWFFFENPVSAVLARKFGSALLTYSMSRRHEITFKSLTSCSPIRTQCPKAGWEI